MSADDDSTLSDTIIDKLAPTTADGTPARLVERATTPHTRCRVSFETRLLSGDKACATGWILSLIHISEPTRRESGFSKLSRTTQRGTHSAFITTRITTRYGNMGGICMAGPKGRLACGSPHSHLTEHNHTCGELELSDPADCCARHHRDLKTPHGTHAVA